MNSDVAALIVADLSRLKTKVSEMETAHRKQLDKLNAKIIDISNELSERQSEHRKIINELNERIKTLEKGISAVKHEQDNSKKAADMQLVEIKSSVGAMVAAEIKPQLDAVRRYVAEQTLDGTQLVTEYRKRVMDRHGSNTGSSTNGNNSHNRDARSTSSNTQPATNNNLVFAFNESD